MTPSILIVGLGNPGPKYQFTRHNMGFIALDWYASNHVGAPGLAQKSRPQWKAERDCDLFFFDAFGELAAFVKPTTFMNLSGQCVRRLMQFYKIPAEKLLVLQDDLDLEFGALKFQKNRGAGGNNGIKSIHAELGHSDYARLKVGIGRPPHPEFEIIDWVLARFSKSDEDNLRNICENTSIAIQLFLEFGFEKAASLLPSKMRKP